MDFKISKNIDFKALAKEYQKKKRLQIPNFLEKDIAEDLYKILTEKTPWRVVYNDGETVHQKTHNELQSLTDRRQREVAAEIYKRAQSQFQYLYMCYPMLDAYLEKWNPGHPLEDFMDFLNDRETVEKIKTVTGHDNLLKADAQATWFRHDHFLTKHQDGETEDTARVVAYVLNMTKGWNPDFGGYLQFYDEKGNIEDGFIPSFNTLNIFSVPQDHSVSYVTPFANQFRLAITGWFMYK